jgi:hypothetical protein
MVLVQVSHAAGVGVSMHQSDDAAHVDYPHGRGYGHDYMRGGEVLGGYGYAEREEYEKPRGEQPDIQESQTRDHGARDSTRT